MPPADPSLARSGAEVLREVGLEALIEFLETTAYGVCITGPEHTWYYLNPAAERVVGGPLAELAGGDYLLHFPEHEREALLALEEDQRQGDTDFYTNTVVRPDGTEVEMTWSGTVMHVNGVELAPAIFYETTPVRRARRTAAEVVAAARASGRGEKPQLLAALVAEGVTGTRAVAGLVVLHDDGLVRLAASHGVASGTVSLVAASGARFADLPGADDLTRGRSIYLSDARRRYGEDSATSGWFPAPAGHDHHQDNREGQFEDHGKDNREDNSEKRAVDTGGPAWRGAAQFPVWREGEVAGFVAALFPPGVTSPSESELAYWSSLADEVSVVVGTELARRTASATSAESERQRIARDLHDSVSQSLFTLQACAAVVRRGLATGDSDLAAEAAAGLEEQARRATSEMRQLLTGLRKPPDDTTDLAAAVRTEVRRVTGSGVPVDVVASPASLPGVPTAVAEHVCRIVGEALHNTHKHAGARQVRVELLADASSIAVVVQDDGKGFDTDAVHHGLGQGTMRERAQLCGGNLVVSSRPGRGTRVEFRVPR